MKRFLLLIAIFLFSSCATEKETKRKIYLAILAHPDDEMAIAPVLAKYAQENTVYLLIGMDGRLGTKPGFPTGDSLIQLRQMETACACQILGVKEAFYLGFSDELSRNETPKFMEHVYYLKQKIKEKIEELNPDVILTFGPDGDTGQSDHRLISNATTEVILNEGWAERFPLYYVAWSKNDSDKLRQVLGFGVNTVHPNYYNVSVAYTDEDETKMIRALSCYKSQMTEAEVKEMTAIEKRDSVNVIHFRKLITSNTNKTEF